MRQALMTLRDVVASIALLVVPVAGQASSSTPTCSAAVSSSVPAPSVAPGYEVRLIAGGLRSPRGITFDSAGHLLVVEQGHGVTALTMSDGPCAISSARHAVVNDTDLNHGITMSGDGRTLYASSPEAVFTWPYDPSTAATTGVNQTIVGNMTTSDHTTRTLLLSKVANGTLVVTRGSTSNIDPEASDISTGHSQIKAFDLNNRSRVYDFNADGQLLGWGLRNDVGIGEEPNGGGLYAVENSVDQLAVQGVDVHEDNPGEKLNFLGYLNGTSSSNQGANFGYPECVAAWTPSSIPGYTGDVAGQFAIDGPGNTTADCAQRASPRLVFQAHMAPLDILFNSAGTEAWITFHGSWDRSDPVGYKLSAVQFANGEPVANKTSKSALVDVVANMDNSRCPNACFRPVGLAFDGMGRLFMSSDSTGEVYMITRAVNGTVNDSAPSPTATAGGSTQNEASRVGATVLLVLMTALAFAMSLS